MTSKAGWRAALALLLGLLASGAARAALEVLQEEDDFIILKLEYEADPLYSSIDRLVKESVLVDIGESGSWIRAGKNQRKQDWLEPLGKLTGRNDLNQQRCGGGRLELPDWPYLQTIVGSLNYTYRFLITCGGQYALVEMVSETGDPDRRDLYLGVKRLKAEEADEYRYSRLPVTQDQESSEPN